MNHLLNKDWEYVLHIYEEEMKESMGWGRGAVSQTYCIKPSATAAPCSEGPHLGCGKPWRCGLPFCMHGRVLDAFFFFFNGHTTDVLVL